MKPDPVKRGSALDDRMREMLDAIRSLKALLPLLPGPVVIEDDGTLRSTFRNVLMKDGPVALEAEGVIRSKPNESTVVSFIVSSLVFGEKIVESPETHGIYVEGKWKLDGAPATATLMQT